MMTHQKGFVLMTVLIFVNLIAILVMMHFVISDVGRRVNSNSKMSLQTLLIAQAGLKIAYMNLQKNNHACLLSEKISAYRLLKKSKTWWHSDIVCRGKFADKDFQYIIEPLSIDECTILNGHRAVQYYRITVRSEMFKDSIAAVTLQGTVVLPIQASKKCEQTERELQSIWQSFRRLQ